MRFVLVCVGRMKAGADKELFDRYLDRAQKIGRGQGVTSVQLVELPESRARKPLDRKAEESQAILSEVPSGARLIVLDENGKSLPSQAFSDTLDSWKLEGVPAVVFAIGGADGHGQEVLSRADVKLAFGSMTWPHQLVRIMLMEQVYRALTIQSGHPYHRE